MPIDETNTAEQMPVAIIGVSALFPGSNDAGGFWRDIMTGKDRLTDVPPHYWLVDDYYDPDPKAPEKTYCRRGGFLDPVVFDPVEFGIPPVILSATDPAQLLALTAAKRVLEDASKSEPDKLDRDKLSVILGGTSASQLSSQMAAKAQRPIWARALRAEGFAEEKVAAVCDRIVASYSPWQESTFPGMLGNVISGRIANRFDLHGSNCVVDAACASALAALSLSIKELALGHSKMVITGGVDATNDSTMYICFSKTPALSPSGDCRPFSASADGIILGEGVGMLALKRLEDAERDGDQIYGVIRGLGSSSDGAAKSIYAPTAPGQATALARAYQAAGYGPETVELVEAHGTGTKAGDITELTALNEVFSGGSRRAGQWCALGSVKSQIGHTKAAAGAAGLLKAVLALHHKVLPGTIKVDKLNPEFDFGDSPFYINTRARPWICDGRHPRRASVSALGFGGSNFHVTLEEYGGASASPPCIRTTGAELLVLSGGTSEALVASCEAVAARAKLDGALAHEAWESQRRFEAEQPFKLAVVARDEADLHRKLSRARSLVNKLREGEFIDDASGISLGWGSTEGRVAFLFPGQGSQFTNMGAELALAFPSFRTMWDRAAGIDCGRAEQLSDVVFPIPSWGAEEAALQQQRLSDTRWAQPAIGVTSAAYLNVLSLLGVQADCAAGHSFGELTALYAAGVIDFDDLVKTSFRRADLMADASLTASGAMTAVAGGAQLITPFLAGCGSDVVVANWNGPRQTVLSGKIDKLREVEERLAEQRIPFRRLPVSTAFHSPIVAPSLTPYRDYLAESIALRSPRFPVYSNAEARPYDSDPALMRELLVNQLVKPVRFAEQVEEMYAAGARIFIEVGPRNVLSSCVKDCLGDRPHLAVSLDGKGQGQVVSLFVALGRLAVRGVRMDFATLWEGYGEPSATRPMQAPAHAVLIDGSGYAKPYPGKAQHEAEPCPPIRNPAAPMNHNAAVKDEVYMTATSKPNGEMKLEDGPRLELDTSPGSEAWLAAFMAIQREARQSQESLQNALLETQRGYLRALELSLSALGARPSTQRASNLAPRLPEPQRPNASATVSAPPARMAPAPIVPIAPIAVHPPASPQVAATARPLAPAASRINGAAPVIGVDQLKRLVLEIVAEKTGYPQGALDLDLDLEGGLGIDSLKRVEILSEIEESAPAVRNLKAASMVSLRTLREILDFLETSLQTEEPPPADVKKKISLTTGT